jgi:arylsulfatase A-like enzyme
MAAEQSGNRPNIILIFVDDMGYSDLGCYGSGTQTPNLDRLADNGLRFTDFYNTPRCCPSRASIMTGLTPHKAGVGWMNFNWVSNVDPDADGYVGTLNKNCVTIAEALKPAGYRSYISGKWHLTADQTNKETWPYGRGFDRSFACIAGTENYFEPKYLTLDDKFYRPPKDCYYTDLIGDYAVKFVDEHFTEHADNPFFMYMPFTAPHFPLQAPEDRVAKYKGRFDHGYEVENKERYERMKELGVIKPQWERSTKPERVPEWDSLPEDEKNWRALVIPRFTTVMPFIRLMDNHWCQFSRAESSMIAGIYILNTKEMGCCAGEITKWCGSLVNRGNFMKWQMIGARITI